MVHVGCAQAKHNSCLEAPSWNGRVEGVPAGGCSMVGVSTDGGRGDGDTDRWQGTLVWVYAHAV